MAIEKPYHEYETSLRSLRSVEKYCYLSLQKIDAAIIYELLNYLNVLGISTYYMFSNSDTASFAGYL